MRYLVIKTITLATNESMFEFKKTKTIKSAF